MKQSFKLKNCYDDDIYLVLDMEKVKYILKEVLSRDDIYTVVYNDNTVECYDSDMHFRIASYAEELEMIYPEHIDLNAVAINPNEKDNFIGNEKEEK